MVIGATAIFLLGDGKKAMDFIQGKDRDQQLRDYLAARTCGNRVCEIGENSKSCPQDCLPVRISADKWTQVSGPYGGWITDLEKVGSTLWAGTSFTHGLGGNGMYKIENGLTWKALGGTNKRIDAIAVDPSAPDNIAFVATPNLAHRDSPEGLFITWDGGKDWHEKNLEVSNYTAVAMSQANSSLVFVGTLLEGRAALFISENDGRDWERTSFLPETEWSVKPIWAGFSDETRHQIQVIAPHPTDENILFVGTISALFKSEDKGQSWERIDATFHRSDIKGIIINPQNPNEVYVRVGVFEELTCLVTISSMREAGDHEKAEQMEKSNCAGVYKSSDLGETWQQLDAYYFDPSEGGIFLDEYAPNTIYAIFSRKILQSKDRGKTWNNFFWTHDEKFIANSGIERLVVGKNSEEVFIGGRQGLWFTEDAGLNWYERNRDFIGTEVVDIVKASDGTLYAGTYSLGMYKSTDGGMSWTFASYNLENPYVMLIAVHPTGPQTVFVTTNGGVYVSRDGALTWEDVGKALGSGFLSGMGHFHGIAFDPRNIERVYVGGGGDQYTPEGSGISISEDGGKTWKQSNNGFETDVHVSKIVVDHNNPAIVYATTQGPTDFSEKTGTGYGIFKSTNYGKTWRKINTGLATIEINTFTIDPNNSDVLYLGTDDDGVYKSTDGGNSWQRLTISHLPASYGVGDIVVDPQNSSIIYVATVDYFRLFMERGMLGDHGVYVSRDAGANWQPFNEGLKHVGAFSLELDAEKNILYVGTRGGGIYWRSVE